MSKTERDLTSPDSDDALGEMFAAEDFESALDEALDGADLEQEHAALDESDRPDDDIGESSDVAGHDNGAEDDDDDDTVESPMALDRGDDDSHDDPSTDDPGADDELGESATSDDEIAARETAAPGLDPDTDQDVDDDEVSDRILEELRRADIDGPVVPFAPQDDTTTARRRPKRAADYDPAPVPIPAKVPRVLGRKPRVRKVTRVVRHVDPWSVFKIALVGHLVLYVTVLTASVLLWNVAYSTNTVDNVERFFESFGWNSFEFNGGELYHAGWIAGLFVVIGLTGLAVLFATLFNLITDLVGGVRFTVLEEEVVEARTSPMRRFVVRRSEPEVPAVLHDGSGVMIREGVVDDAGANDRPTR